MSELQRGNQGSVDPGTVQNSWDSLTERQDSWGMYLPIPELLWLKVALGNSMP